MPPSSPTVPRPSLFSLTLAQPTPCLTLPKGPTQLSLAAGTSFDTTVPFKFFLLWCFMVFFLLFFESTQPREIFFFVVLSFTKKRKNHKLFTILLVPNFIKLIQLYEPKGPNFTSLTSYNLKRTITSTIVHVVSTASVNIDRPPI
jgi:hypothetical protein